MYIVTKERQFDWNDFILDVRDKKDYDRKFFVRDTSCNDPDEATRARLRLKRKKK